MDRAKHLRRARGEVTDADQAGRSRAVEEIQQRASDLAPEANRFGRGREVDGRAGAPATQPSEPRRGGCVGDAPLDENLL